MMATCYLCPPTDNRLPDHDMLNHLRVLHPDIYGTGPETWPDGQIVVHDTTLTAAHFAEYEPNEENT